MSDHICDKALTIEQHGKDIANLFEGRNALTGRMTQMETTLYGAERNGAAGFLKEMRVVTDVMAGQVKTLVDKKAGLRSMMLAAIPSLIVGAVTIATVLLTRKP